MDAHKNRASIIDAVFQVAEIWSMKISDAVLVLSDKSMIYLFVSTLAGLGCGGLCATSTAVVQCRGGDDRNAWLDIHCSITYNEVYEGALVCSVVIEEKTSSASNRRRSLMSSVGRHSPSSISKIYALVSTTITCFDILRGLTTDAFIDATD